MTPADELKAALERYLTPGVVTPGGVLVSARALSALLADYERMREALDVKAQVTTSRKRQDPKRWPPGMTADQIEASISALCGCGGKRDCDCVSVINRAKSNAWYEHNAGGE